MTIIAISAMTSPTDINVPTRGALVLETKASFLLLRFVNSDVSYTFTKFIWSVLTRQRIQYISK